MRRNCGVALAATTAAVALAGAATAALAATHVDVGANNLLPNTPNQVITLQVTNDVGTTPPDVTDFAGYFQIGPNTLDQVVPVFQSADFIGTFWTAGSAGGVGPEPGLSQLMQKGFSLEAGSVAASGNLINLVIDTTGISSGTFDLKLTNNAYTDDFAQNSLFLPTSANADITINNGSITIVAGPTNHYWDVNGTAAGAGGATPAGNWDGVAQNFNSDATGGAGGAMTAAPAATDNVVFAAGGDATGSYTVTVSGTRSAAALQFEEGNLMLAGGTLAVGTFDVAAGAAASISSTVAGGGASSLTKTGPGTLTLAAANTHAGGTTVSAGTLVLANADATAGGAVDVQDGALAQAQAGLPTAVTVSTLNTNTSGKFDLTNNSMVVKGMTAGQVRAQLQAGYNGGAWNGAAGIVSTNAAASTETSVGYASNTSLGLTEFKGVTGLAAGDVIVKYTYAGDANLDGKVDIGDLGLLAGAWQQLTGKVWFDGDFTYDGAVNIGDLGLLAGNWQKGVAPGQPLMDFNAAVAQFAAFDDVVMPEPASLSLLALGGGLALGRRRRAYERRT